MSEKKRIIFVDDEPNVLEGLGRMLRSMRGEWDASFVESGSAALEMLESGQFDVIVSDMRMTGMTGQELLEEVRRRHPEVVRIALSGQAEKETILKCVGPVQQYLAKPCDAETLKHALYRSLSLKGLLKDEKLKRLISQIDCLPCLPSLYLELMEEIKNPDPSLKAVEHIISQDIGMTMKILQLVNSAFFGVPRHVSSAGQAVTLLGLDTIESLVLSIQIFNEFDGTALKDLSLKELWGHALSVSACAKAIAKSEKADSILVDHAFIGGLLHDVGKVILGSKAPKKYGEVMEMASSNGTTTIQAEEMVFGCTHAVVGAYLLTLWGFSDHIVEAVAFHHNPQHGIAGKFSPLTAVHVADAYVNRDGQVESELNGIDTVYITEIGKLERLPKWEEISAGILEEKEMNDG